jgi:aarF domain-containing kinase
VYEEQVEALAGRSLLWPGNFYQFVKAYASFVRVAWRLGAYEMLLRARAVLGMGAMEVAV